jgi:hypothetical protein
MSTVTVATGIVSTALSVLSAARERAKTSKDADLKHLISTLYDHLLDLKEALSRLSEENSELRRTIAQLEKPPAKREPELRQVGAVHFYFDGDKGPCCQPCYDGKGKLTVLTEPETWNGGVRRQCLLCGEHFYEKPMSHRRGQVPLPRGPAGY